METTALAQTSDMLRTAAQHASANVPIAAVGDSADRLLTDLRGQVFDSASVIAVCEEDRLVGLVTIERLLAAPTGTRVADVMDRAGWRPAAVISPQSSRVKALYRLAELAPGAPVVVSRTVRRRGSSQIHKERFPTMLSAATPPVLSCA